MHIPLLGDVISNLHPLKHTIRHQDYFLNTQNNELKKSLQPDLLITYGKSVISKNLKLFLREYKPQQHWHIEEIEKAPDTYQSLTWHIQANILQVLELLQEIQSSGYAADQKQQDYFKLWQTQEKNAQSTIFSFFQNQPFGELEATMTILSQMPFNTKLHLANSMPVRLANFAGLRPEQHQTQVFCNRGTSGIDGCASTAVGCALSTSEMVVLLTGDMAFLYDRNAYWHNYSLPNLRIIVLNNHGGGIFSMIEGPTDQPELEEYFVTRQELSAAFAAKEYEFEYFFVNDKNALDLQLPVFFKPDRKTKVMEIETSNKTNREIFRNFKALNR